MKPTTDRGAAQQIIRALVRDGWEIYGVSDTEEWYSANTEEAALRHAFDVDDAAVHFSRKGNQVGWVRFVWGNDPEEAAADWTINLSGTLDPLTEEWWL